MRIKLLISALILLNLSCSNEASKNYLPPFTKDKKVTDGNASDIFDPKADILFVVDDSGSMSGHQRNLSHNIGLFTSVFLQTSILDYNIGVITTDNDGFWGGSSSCCGKLVGTYRVVTKTTPNSNLVLQENLTVGINGSGREAPFETTSLALSNTMLTGWNSGFIRPSAALIVIFITDAEDQSRTTSPQSLLAEMLALKNNDKRRVLSYGAIIPTGVNNCDRDSWDTPQRIEEFLDIVPNGAGAGGVGGNIVSLCAPDYGQRLAEFALQIVDQISSTIYLTRLPDPKSLRVSYGSEDLPMDPKKGWSYSPALNAIFLGSEIDWTSQPNGSKVEVHYKEARG